MAERSDVTVDWGGASRSTPRIITVAAPSSEILIQDLVDTLRSNTLQAGEPGDGLENMDDDFILDATGKEQLVGGIQVGITATLKNARIKFADRAGPATETMLIAGGNLVTELEDTGSHTGASSNTVYIDPNGGFLSFGLEPGMTVENIDDGSSATVVSVDSDTQITTDGLTGGFNDLFTNGDTIVVTGFTSPVEPSAFTTVAFSSSASATIANLPTISERVEELWKLFGLDACDSITVTPSGITSESGDITINFTGDGVNSTTQTRESTLACPADELVPDPEFNDALDWNIAEISPPTPAGTSVLGGTLFVGTDLIPPTVLLGNSDVKPTNPPLVTVGQDYEYTVVVPSYSSGNGLVFVGGVSVWDQTQGAGTFTGTVTATTTELLRIVGVSAGFEIDSVSIKDA